MTLDFDLKFYVNRTTNSYSLLFTDQTDYTVAGVVKGFYRIEYPDGLIVENTDQNNPDFTDSDESTTLSLRLFKFKLITGTYIITQKIYIDDVLYSLQRSISLTFVEPSITAANNSNVTTPSVSFLDSTDYTVAGYTSTKTRLFSAFFPTTSDLDGTEKTTSTTELIMVDSGNYYEGIYNPTINIDSTYTGTNHDVQWVNEKSFEFDIRKFYGYANLITLIDNFKETVKTPKDEQTYQMVMSLYSHLIGRINSGDTDIQDLISEILELTTGSCGCSSYTYQSGPITVDEIPGGSTSFPYIDQVIYREWSDSIVFKSTSTVFHRVSGKIRWFKSKQNDNTGNPIFIDSVLNDTWWEEITLGSSGDSECIVRTKFTYEGGPKVFALPYDPEGIFQFYVEGNLQDESLYSFAGSIVTFTGSLSAGEKVDIFSTGCDFTFTDISTSDVIRIADFTYSGSSTFTLPEPANYIFMVFKNGKKLDPEDYDHTIDTDEITIIEELDEEIEADRITVFYAIDKSFYIASFDPLKDVSGGFAANDTSIYSLDTVDQFSGLNRRNRTRFYVNDTSRGGMFSYVPSGVTPDGGTIFALSSGYAVRNYSGQVNVRWFGAKGDGVTNDTAAIQAAIDAFPSGLITVYFPAGNYLVTSTITISDDRVNLIGDQNWGAKILFNPTADDICIFVGKGGEGATNGGVIFQCTIDGLTFFSSNTTFKKTAIEVKDISQCLFKNIIVGSGSNWNGAGSIGIRTRGREASIFERLTLIADKPLVIGRNTNFVDLCADHFLFRDVLTYCSSSVDTSYANITVEPGTNLTNTTFTGYQVWLKGRYGFHLDHTSLAASSTSFNVRFDNVRWEGDVGQDDTGYAIYVDYGAVSTMQSMIIDNLVTGEIGKGFYFRKILNVTLRNTMYLSTTREALTLVSVGGTEVLKLENCFWQSGSTSTIDAAFYLYGALASNNSQTLPRSGEYSASSSRRDFRTGGAIHEWKVSATGASEIITLPLRSVSTVMFVITDSRGAYAFVAVNSFSKAVALIHNDGNWTTTKDTASKLNIYWDAPSTTYKVQNLTGVSRIIFLQSLGSHLAS